MRALAVLLFLPAAAQAQDLLSESHFARNFCWERTYSRSHLDAHPEQQVTRFEIGREPPGHPSAPGELLMELRVRIRAEGEEMVSIGTCQPDGEALRCTMEGDAGNFEVEAQGPDHVLVEAGDRGMGFEGDSGFYDLRPDEGDDQAFLLGRCG